MTSRPLRRRRLSPLATAIALLVAPTMTHAAPLCAASLAQIDRSAATTMAQGTPGMIVAVAHAGEPVLVRGYGIADLEHRAPMTSGAVFRMASITKQFTAAAVLALVEDGTLSLDDPLSRHLPDLRQPLGSITLRQLLWQTSGIPDYAEDPEGQPWNAGGRTQVQMLAWIARLARTPDFAPGTRWRYSNSNYVLLGAAIERAAGKPLAAVFAERLFRRAGLRDTAFDVAADVVPGRVRGYAKSRTAPSGFVNAAIIDHSIPGAAGGLRTTAADLLRWSDALFAGRVISPASVRTMTAPGLLGDGRTTKAGMPPEWQQGLNADYAMGLFVTPTAHGPRLWHTGDIAGFSTWLAHYPERRVTILLAENSESADLDKDTVERAVFQSLDGRCSRTAGAAPEQTPRD